ncbi:MAG TPA: nuclear transport factor 2 family protein [Chitinophagaceae bacterium]|nr:nuclear transport factor 2 family protein [Chitinophagaceae bacterium]
MIRVILVSLFFLQAQYLFSQTTNTPMESDTKKTRQEKKNLAIIKEFHTGATPVKKFIESGLMSDSIEWWVPGPKNILPFAGMWKGVEGLNEFSSQLGKTMRYDKVEIREYIIDGDKISAIFWGEGIAISTGKPFHSEILRLYTFKDGKIIKVRNYYDTNSYVAALTK